MRGLLEGGIYSKKEKESQRLRIGGGSWSINLDELYGKTIETVEYITEKKTYTIEFDKAMDKGFVRYLGGEKKLVVPIKYWSVND